MQVGTASEYLLFSALNGEVSDVTQPLDSLIALCEQGYSHCAIDQFKRYILCSSSHTDNVPDDNMWWYCRYLDPVYPNCYTYSINGSLSSDNGLKLVLYLSSNAHPSDYQFSDFMPFNPKAAFIQVGYAMCTHDSYMKKPLICVLDYYDIW